MDTIVSENQRSGRGHLLLMLLLCIGIFATTSAGAVQIFSETFPNADGRWHGSGDTAQDEPGWNTRQGNGDNNDVQVSNEDVANGSVPPSGGNHLTFEDCDQGFGTPETYDSAYVSVDLGTYVNVVISYYWQSDDVDNNEGLRVAYSTDTTDGADGTWTQIAEYLNPAPDDSWSYVTFDLPNVDAVSTFVLRFSSRQNRANEHMYVDDVVITGDIPPVVNNNGGATTVTDGTATLNGQVTAGDPTPDTYIYYGPTDEGTTQSAWSNEVSLGTQSGVFSTGATGLAPLTTYYYRCYVTNAGGEYWSPVTNFNTFGPLSVDNANGATAVIPTGATLNGELFYTGGEDPGVYVYWGLANGGTNIGSWSDVESLGTLTPGTFSTNLTGLTVSQTYYYRCFVSNSYGYAWAPETTNFFTQANPPVVTNQPASNFAADSADLNGEITFTGGEDPNVYVYWGTSDGVATFGAWDTSEYMGILGAVSFGTNVTGLVPGTTYFYRCFATNSAAGTWATPTESFTLLLTPTVDTLAPTAVLTNTATANGDLTFTGGENPDVYIYWGTNNAGTDPLAWQNSSYFGALGAGTFSTNLTGLSAATEYFYRAFATNSVGGTWAAAATNFTTLTGPPVVVNQAASGITSNSATLNGSLTSTGGDGPTVRVYWGTTDGGVTPGNWDTSELLGTLGIGAFATNLTGLSSGTKYYFRCYATNSAGDSWASASTVFYTSAEGAGWIDGYTFRKKITVSSNMVYGSADLTNFGLLVSIPSDPDLANTNNGGNVVSEDGYDIVFTGSDGPTTLDHEVELYAATNGRLVAWVRMAALPPDTDTVIYMYYGNTSITSSQENVSGVWSNNCESVAHMANASNQHELDSVSESLDYIKAGTTLDSVPAQIGNGKRSTANGDNDYLKNNVVAQNVYPHTFMMWLYVEQTPTVAWGRPMSREPPGSAGMDWEINQAGGYVLRQWIGNEMDSATVVSTGQWYFLATTFDSPSGAGTGTIYFDGNQDQQGGNTARADDGPLVLWRSGKGTGRAMPANTVIDEFRLYNVCLSGDYIKTIYYNQFDPTNYVTVGPPKRKFTWLGTVSTNWSKGANWAGGYVPGPDDDTYFDSYSLDCALVEDSSCSSLFTSGFSNELALGVFNLDIGSDLQHAGGTISLSVSAGDGLDVTGVLSNSATIACSGVSRIKCNSDWVNDGTFTASDSVVTFAGTSEISGSATTTFNTITIDGSLDGSGTTFNVASNFVNNGTFTAGDGTVAFTGSSAISGSTTTTLGNVTVSGTLNAPAGALNVASNFVNNGTFNAGAGTVNFSGITAVSGSSTTTLGNLTISGTLDAPAGTLNISGNIQNNGTFNAGTGTIDFTGATTVSGSSTTTLGNVTVSGTLNAPSAIPLNVSSNFVNNGTFNAGSGTVDFTGLSAISGSSTSTFNNLTISGELVAPAGTLNVSGDMVNNGTFDANSGTIDFNGTTAISGSSESTFHNVVISGTLSASGITIGVTGNFSNSGTFNAGTGTVRFEGTTQSTIAGNSTFNTFSCVTSGKHLNFTSSSTQTIDTFLLTGNSTNFITLRSTSDGVQWLLDVTNSAGVSFVDVKDSDASPGLEIVASSSTNSLNNTNWLFSTTYYYVGSASDWDNASNWSLTSGGTPGAGPPGSGDDVRFDANSGSCTLDADAVCLSIDTEGFAGTLAMGTYSLEIEQGLTHKDGTITIGVSSGAGLDVGSAGIINSATITCAGASVVSCAGNWVNDGTFSESSSLVTFDGVSEISGSSAHSFANITVTGSLTAPTNNMEISGAFDNSGSFDNNGGTVVFDGTTTISGSSTAELNDVSITGTLTASSGALKITGDFDNDGTFNHGSGTVEFSGDTTVSGSSASTFNNVTISDSLTAPAGTMSVAGNWVNNGTFSDGGGTVAFAGSSTVSGSSISEFNNITVSGTLNAPATTMRVGGAFSNNGTFDAGTGTVEFDGTTAISGSSISSFNTMLISGSLTAPSGQMNVASNFVNNGSFNDNSGTVVFDGTTVISGSTTSAFNNVTISGSLAASPDTTVISGVFVNNGSFDANGGNILFDGTTTVSGSSVTSFHDITIGGTLSVSSGDTYVAGDFVNNGTFNASGGTMRFNGTTTVSGSSTTTFNNVQISGTLNAHSGTMNVAGDFSSSGTFDGNGGTVVFSGSTIVSGSGITFHSISITGSVSAPGITVDIQGDFDNNGSFSNNGGTVVFSGSGTSTVSGNTEFDEFRCTTSAKTITFEAGSTQTVDTLTLSGTASGGRIVLRSSVDTSWWFIEVTNSSSVGLVNVKDSNADGGNTIYASSSIDNGHNTNWVFSLTYYFVGGWYPYSSNLVANGSFETALGTEWTKSGSGSGALAAVGNFGLIGAAQDGALLLTHTTATDSDSGAYQDIDLSAWATEIADADAQITSSAYLFSGDDYYQDTRYRVIFYDASMTEIPDYTYDSEWLLNDPDSWTEYGVVNYPVPTNAATVRVWGQFRHFGAEAGGLDNVSLSIRTALETNWVSGGNWSDTSGGTNIIGVPGPGDDVVFDENSGDCYLDTAATALSLNTENYIRTLHIGEHDLTVEQGLTHAGGTITIGTSTNTGLTVGSSIDISDGATLDANGESIISVGGDFINSGTVDSGESTVTFTGTGKISGSSITEFHDVIVTGELTGHATAFKVKGNWTGTDGVFVNNSGAVIFSGTNTQYIYTGGSYIGNTNAWTNNWKNNWYDLEVLNTSTGGVIFADGFEANALTATNAGTVLYFAAMNDSTNLYEVTGVNGLQLFGKDNSRVKLKRWGGEATDQWEIYPSGGDWSVSYVDVANSVNTASNAIYPGYSVGTNANNVNWFTPTLAAMAWFEAIGRDNSVTVRWKTGSEVNNIGFNIYRDTNIDGPYSTRINVALIRGLGTSTSGREYAFPDIAVTNGTTYFYKLESVEFSGRTESFGPVAAAPGVDSDGDGMTDDWEDFYGLMNGVDDSLDDPDIDGLSNIDEFGTDTNPKLDEGADGEGYGGGPGPVAIGDSGIYRMTVTQDGVYRLDYSYLSANVTNLSNWITGNIRVFNQGAEIPLREHDEGDIYFGVNDYVEFYGTGLDTRFTDANVYWLYNATNAGLRAAEPVTAGGDTVTDTRHVARLERDEYYTPQLPDESPDDDHWFLFDYLSVWETETNSATVYPVSLNAAAASTTATLRVALRPSMDSDAHATFHVEFDLNGSNLVTAADWTGWGEYVYETTVPQSLLADTNALTLTLTGEFSTFYEEILINWVEIEYQRTLIAQGDRFNFTPEVPGVQQFDVAGFSSGAATILRVAGATDISAITNYTYTGGTISFADNATPGASYVLCTDSAKLAPDSCVEDSGSDLRSTTNRADYIIIAPYIFHDALVPLVTERESGGLDVELVDIQDVYDDFNHGVFSPYAIRDFLNYARSHWKSPTPAYVLLVGDGTYDYRDNEELGAVNYVPAKMVHDIYGEIPSDNWFVSISDSNPTPAMHIGRFPVTTTNDLTVIVNKIIAYEAVPADQPWSTNIMLVADDDDSVFEDTCDLADSFVPSWLYNTDNIYLSAIGDAGTCRSQVIDGINAGRLMVVYAGHGNTTYWAAEKILRDSDIGSLTNASALPVIVTPTCMNGYFVNPQGGGYDEAFSESLLRAEGRGAIACLSPSGWSAPPDQQKFANDLLETILQDGTFEIGPALSRAKLKVYEALGGAGRTIIDSFILFGDPALQLKKPSAWNSDTDVPTVVSTTPAHGFAGLADPMEINVEFSDEMDAVSTFSAFRLDPTVDGTLTFSDNVLKFVPNETLPNGPYSVTIGPGARSVAGVPMGVPYQFSFSSSWVAVSGALTYDIGPPGLYKVLAGLTPGSWSTTGAVTTITVPGNYTLTTPRQTGLWLRAFRDYNGNGTLDSWEPRGEYPANPVNLDTDIGNIDIALSDPDSDGDGLVDFLELFTYRTDPDKADSDGDGLSDSNEIAIATDPLLPDTDGDGMLDGWEVANSLDPKSPADEFGDNDADLVFNYEEHNAHSSPILKDTDNDGLDDFKELFIYATDPTVSDTDGDGMGDGDETIAGSDPDNRRDLFQVDQLTTPTAGTFTMSCDGYTNRLYTLMCSTNLASTSNWNVVGIKTGTPGTVMFINVTPAAHAYYRIDVRKLD